MFGKLRSVKAIGLAIAGLLMAAAVAPAQTKWPTRPVKFIVTLGAGSGADIGARLIADRLGQRWGQPVIVENRPGGDGIVAINAFVGAHDDHVLLYGPSGSFTAHPYLHDSLPYKLSDLIPITRVSNTVVVIAVPADIQVRTLADLAAQARAEPGKLNWAGVTGTNDFMFAGWLEHEHLNMTKVPYRNAVDAAKDLGEGRVQVYLTALAIVRPQLDSGKIRLICVTNAARAPMIPDVPTAQEAGHPLLMLDGLVGLFGPPNMPRELRDRITADIRAAADATVADRLTKTGQIMNIGGPDEFAQSIDEQRARLSAIAKELGVSPVQ
jgi:tripartite-type tricarboxylate transporter receptor subunit TctC